MPMLSKENIDVLIDFLKVDLQIPFNISEFRRKLVNTDYIYLDFAHPIGENAHMLPALLCPDVSLIYIKTTILLPNMIDRLISIMQNNSHIVAVNLPAASHKKNSLMIDDICIGRNFLWNISSLFSFNLGKQYLAMFLATTLMPDIFNVTSESFAEYLEGIKSKNAYPLSYVETIFLGTSAIASPFLGTPLSLVTGAALTYLASQLKNKSLEEEPETEYGGNKLNIVIPNSLNRREFFSIVLLLMHIKSIHLPVVKELYRYKETLMDCLIDLLNHTTPNNKWQILNAITKTNNLLGAVINYQRSNFGYYIGSFFKCTNSMELLIKLKNELKAQLNEELQFNEHPYSAAK